MNLLRRVFLWLYFLYAALLFLIMMIPVAVFAVIVAPMGAIRGGNLIYSACRVWADIWFPLVGIIHHTTYQGEDHQKGEYVYIANHISWLDAALIPKTFRHPIRPLGKAEVAKVPIFGFIYRKAVVSVDRSSAEARHRSVLRLKSVLRRGVSILVFPEGTFNETHEPLAPFFDGAFRIAIETGRPIRPVIFLDTYDRMPYEKTVSLNPGKSRAIFLDEIPVEGLTSEDIPMLKELARNVMTEQLLAFKASWIRGNSSPH